MTKKQEPGDKPKGRFRKVEVRTWGDAKFRELSPIPACGQGLWLYLITGPHTGPIPGLFRAGRAGMAEALGWEQEAFDKAFREVFQQGMAEADFKAMVIWVPKAVIHNKPESPNVVRSWVGEFDLIPECALKWKAFEALKASIHALGEAYGKAFDEAFGKASSKPPGKTTGNQEQEQEQESSVPKGTGGGAASGAGEQQQLPGITEAAAASLTKDELWKAGKSLLEQGGMPKDQCGTFVGKLVKDYTDLVVVEAVRAAVVARPPDAPSYLKATCQRLAGQRGGRRPFGPTSHSGLADKDYSQGVTPNGTLA